MSKSTKLLKKIFNGMVLPVFSEQLRGTRLKIDPLLPAALFWNNVEEEVHRAYDVFIREGDTIFDVGANVGLHSYYISKKNKKVSIFAFEPFPPNANYIKKMIKLNNFNNITVIEKAVSSESGISYFNNAINNHQGHLTSNKSNLKVTTTSLDDFIQLENIIPGFIKIDVEGAESEVLLGFAKKIKEVSPIIIIEVHNKTQGELIAKFFTPLSYTICRILNKMDWNRNKPFKKIEDKAPDLQSENGFFGQIVAIPNSKIPLFNSFIE